MAPKVMKRPAASKTTKGKGQIGQESLVGQIGQKKLGGHKGQAGRQTEASFVADGGVLTTPSDKSTPGGVASPYYDPGTAHLVRQQGRVTVRSGDGSLLPETSRLPRWKPGVLNRGSSSNNVYDACGSALDVAMLYHAPSCGRTSNIF